MNRPRSILSTLRLGNSLRSTFLRTAHLQETQVTHLSDLVSLRLPFDSHQRLCFSTQPNSLLQLVCSKDWSAEVEAGLDKAKSEMTHETFVYILRNLDRDPKKASAFFDWAFEKNGFTASSSVYSLMLRVLARKDLIVQFWVVLGKMKGQGFYLDEDTLNTISSIFKKEKMSADVVALDHFYNRMLQDNAMDGVAKKVVGVILGSDWSDEVEKELESLKLDASDNVVMRVLKELRHHPSGKALNFFRWVGQQSGFKHNSVTYNGVLRVLARHDSVGEFWAVFEDMKAAGILMDVDTYIKVSRAFQKCNMKEEAVKLYELMMDGPYKPSYQDISMLMRNIASSRNPDLGLVYRVVNKYEESGGSLSKVMYDGIHRALTSLGSFDEAEKVVETMENAGYKPDNITYSQLVFGLCKAGRLAEARKVVDDMDASGCTPDIVTWTILIKWHCDAHELDEALICFADMMKKNCQPDADLLDVLIDGFLKQNKLDGACKILVEMVGELKLKPWQATYKCLIEKLLEERKLEEAMKLLVSMKKNGYPPFPEPFIRYLSKFGSVADAMEFLKALSVKQHPSNGAYNHILTAFCREGRHSDAHDLLYKCPHHIRNDAKISRLFGSSKIPVSASMEQRDSEGVKKHLL